MRLKTLFLLSGNCGESFSGNAAACCHTQQCCHHLHSSGQPQTATATALDGSGGCNGGEENHHNFLSSPSCPLFISSDSSREVGLFTEIQVLDVSYNTLMGHVPDTLSCLQDIQVLNLPIQGSLLMDDGELDFSNQEVFSSPNMAELPSSGSMDCFFEELLKDSHACTHTHICNPLVLIIPILIPATMFIPRLCLRRLRSKLELTTLLSLLKRSQRSAHWVIGKPYASTARRRRLGLLLWRMRLSN
ncbi:hypothetical protein HN51_035940 [Arachis hypogaea]